MLILGKERHNFGKIRASGTTKPVEGSNNGTELCLKALAIGREHVFMWDVVNW